MTDRARPSRSRRQLLVAAAGVTVVLGVSAVWVGVHRVPWLGPRLHDVGVAVFGRTAMGWFERIAYAADAGWNKLWGVDERPEAHWNLPDPAASPGGSAGGASKPAWTLHSPGPMVFAPFSKEDGLWFPIAESSDGRGPLAYRITLHPDGDRAGALVKIVAIDRSRTETKLSPGRAIAGQRGQVPEAERARLIAVVIPGERAVRGGYGLSVNGAVLERPKATGCVVWRDAGGMLDIGYWQPGDALLAAAQWWMQAPRCVLDHGELQPGVDDGAVWGGRRTILALSRDGKVLFAAVATNTTEATVGRALRHAGAWKAALLATGDERGNVLVSGAGGLFEPDGEREDPSQARDVTVVYVLRRE